MADTIEKKALLETAKIYEQILSKMPEDVYSIEELIGIYQKIGDSAKVDSFNERLEKIKLGEEVDPLPIEVEQRQPHVASNFRVSNTNHVSNRKVNLKPRPSVTPPVPLGWRKKNVELDKLKLNKQLADLVFTLQHTLKSQVDLLIRLHAVGILDDNQMAETMYALSEHKFSRKPVKPRMVMHMLADCDGVDQEKVYYFLSRKSQLPYVDLSLMSFNAKLYELFPVSLIYNQGMVVFKKIGNDFCVAVLNPLNDELMESVAALLGETVHYFFTSAREFDRFLKKNPRS